MQMQMLCDAGAEEEKDQDKALPFHPLLQPVLRQLSSAQLCFLFPLTLPLSNADLGTIKSD